MFSSQFISMTDNKPVIEVREDKVYGRILIYPSCDKAKIFTRMLGRKTLTDSDIEYIKNLGYEIKYK